MLERQSTAGKDKARVALGYGDREPGRDHRAPSAGSDHASLDREQVTPRITVVGVGRYHGILVEDLHLDFHMVEDNGRIRGRSTIQ